MLRALYFSALVSVTLAPALRGQEVPPAPPPVPIPALAHEQLADWDVKCYEHLVKDFDRVRASAAKVQEFRPNRVGVVLTGTWLSDDGVHMLDQWTERGSHRHIQERTSASRDSDLTLQNVKLLTSSHYIEGDREGEALPFTIDGAPGSVDLPPATLSVATLMRLVTLLPQDPGVAYLPRPFLETPAMELSDFGPRPIICEGAVTYRLRGYPQEATRYRYGPYLAYVRNNDRVLLRLEMPSYEYLELMKDGDCCPGEKMEAFIAQIEAASGDDQRSPEGGAPTPADAPAAEQPSADDDLPF